MSTEHISKAEVIRQGERLSRANRGLLAVIQHLMGRLGSNEVTIPIAELGEANRVDIVSDNEQLTVLLKPAAADA